MTDNLLDIDALAKRGKDLIKHLGSGDLPAGGIKLPQRELQQCAGMAFTFVKKAGAVLTVDMGSGFVLAKVPNPDGTTRWSAPLFINVFGGGVGLTLGVSQIDSTILLNSPEAVAAYSKNQFDLATDATAAGPLGHVGGHISDSDVMAVDANTLAFSIASGAIIDFSYKGMRYSLDSKRNLETYGPDATPQAILEGKMEAPAPMAQLTDTLTKFMTEGRV